MIALLPFIEGVLRDGEAVLSDAADSRGDDRSALARRLEAYHREYHLEIAGPPISYDPAAALMAAESLWLGCWFLVHRDAPPVEVARLLAEPREPTTAAAHLSADLLLRFVPQVYHRARGLAADDLLTIWLARLLRKWPLAGVLADLDDAPLSDLDYDGHPGLQLLHAERLAQRPRAAWVPAGTGREAVELVFAERGLHVPVAALLVATSG